MGLDMYAYARAAAPAAPVDFPQEEGDQAIAYWRKHPNLHGWMERLYRQKGGQGEHFNCDNLVLTTADLDQLEADVKANTLPHTTGFFFGQSRPDEQALDLAFIEKARAAIAEGKTVYYSSWW